MDRQVGKNITTEDNACGQHGIYHEE